MVRKCRKLGISNKIKILVLIIKKTVNITELSTQQLLIKCKINYKRFKGYTLVTQKLVACSLKI